ncbi:MAG TPA: hypothetical protein PLQ88_25325, partial [Blastocatellia bacterium]|nr:hypothetical protein [Blastocatellia bacterium]
FEHIDDLLQQALELETDERTAFLDEVCAGDAALRRELDELLNEEVETGEFLRRAPQSARAFDQTQGASN